ncbi:MAG: hypothetical protein NOU37_09215 [Candidatus Brocadiales bacterium]|nr:hypothetical protein [Candidatus Bathyanammoxibius amoris]
MGKKTGGPTGRPKGYPKSGGRKPGVQNRITVSRQEQIASEGITPLEFMLNVLRDDKADMKDKMWAAQAAAPYVHPRLQNLQVHGAPEGDLPPVKFKIEVINGDNGRPTDTPAEG